MRQKAVEQKLLLAGTADATSGQWSAIGPQPIQSYGTAYSGRIWGIGVDPRNSSVVYIGTDGGGVWKTTNGGTTWLPLTDSQANMNIRDLTLAPSAPDTIFAATAGGGILRSTNDGATWTVLHPGGPYADYLSSVAVHPTNASIVLAADSYFNNVFRSADGGNTWNAVLGPGAMAWADPPRGQVAFDPSNGSIAYAVLADGLHRSTDAGQTWSLAGTTGLPSVQFGWLNFAIAPSNTAVLYLALKGTNDHLIGFYRSTNSGATWSQVGVPPNDDVTYWGWSLRVHPTNPNVIYAGSLRLSRSTDGGTTWASNDSGLHVDHHVQTYSADGSTLYVGNDGGVWSTTTPTAASTSWTNLNTTLNTAMFYPGISISPLTLNTAFGGTQDNGILKYQGALAWTEAPPCGDGGFTAIDSVLPQKVYVACQAGSVNEVNASTDGGQTFHAAQSGINLQDSSDFIPPLVMDPSNSSRLYFGTYRVYQTLNGASSWTAISSNQGSSYQTITTIAVAPSDPNTVYTGAPNGVVFLTRNALSGTGATWTEHDLPIPQTVTQITVDPVNPLTAWAAATGGIVYRTINGGGAWTALTNGLPNLTVNDVLVDPDIANTVYVATDVGVYRSVDNGQSWLPLGTGLPNVIANSLRMDRTTRTLRVATYGRGMWDLSIPVAGQVSVTIASSLPGAYFSLEDGSTHQAPVSFYWYTGAQHTVTWQTAGGVGTRYIFSGWSDGVSQNGRVITVPSAAATYTGNISAQYLLTVASSPSSAGTITLTPGSSDGYYNAGTSVQISATAANGYAFWYLSGDLSGSVPQSITMSAPHTVTTNFYCQYAYNYLPDQLGSGSTSGFFQILTGASCGWNLAPGATWFTLTSPSNGVGPATVAFSVAANAGVTRSMVLAISGPGSGAGNYGYSYQPTIGQDASSTGRATVVSMQPNIGSGSTQTFTLQFQDPNGFSHLAQVGLDLEKSPYLHPACDMYLWFNAGYTYLNLANDNANYLPSIQIPSGSTVHNSQCTIDASQSSVSGSGNILTVKIAVTFTPSYSGSIIAAAWGFDSANNNSSREMVGTWTVTASAGAVLSVAKSHSGSFTQGQANAPYTVTVTNQGTASTSGQVSVTETLPSGLTLVSMTGAGWTCGTPVGTCTRSDALSPGSSYPAITVTVNVSWSAASPLTNTISVSGGGSATATAGDVTTIVAPVALAFVPITPCRVADTRNPTGPFGGPKLTGGSTRNFIIPSGACGIPSTAQAYSLNAAIVPTGGGWITLWGAGQPQPLAASVNSPDGRVKSNGAIVPAGTGGAVSLYASVTTDVVLDVNGYFVPAFTNPTALAFYPVTPCRIADTRNATGSLGGPYMSGGSTRTFPVLAATACNIPSSAQAFSLNLAVVPLTATLGWLTAWPTGQSQPYVASLNDPPGVILSNGAIVPAPSDHSGQINIFATQDTHVVIDINGYFAPPGTGGLYLYAVQPCRVLDTRYPSGSSPYSGTLAVDVVDSGCGAPSTAKDYVFNATVVPPTGAKGYLTMWPQGLGMPLAANLNTSDGAITGNMALVPTSNGWINAYFSGTTHLVLDLFGYFAQ